MFPTCDADLHSEPDSVMGATSLSHSPEYALDIMPAAPPDHDDWPIDYAIVIGGEP